LNYCRLVSWKFVAQFNRQALGLMVPLAVLACADEVMEQILFAAVHESGSGPTRKCGSTPNGSAYWGRAEKICSVLGLPSLTRTAIDSSFEAF
jgi:hypothetical protein